MSSGSTSLPSLCFFQAVKRKHQLRQIFNYSVVSRLVFRNRNEETSKLYPRKHPELWWALEETLWKKSEGGDGCQPGTWKLCFWILSFQIACGSAIAFRPWPACWPRCWGPACWWAPPQSLPMLCPNPPLLSPSPAPHPSSQAGSAPLPLSPAHFRESNCFRERGSLLRGSGGDGYKVGVDTCSKLD